MKEIALITGASSGMGEEFAKQIVRDFQIQEVWLVARRKEKLEDLAALIDRNSGVSTRVIDTDLSVQTGRDKLFALLKQETPNIKILINNAGYGDRGDFVERKKEKQLGMIDLNVYALTEITYECLSLMKRGSAILQVASLAAFVPMPHFSVYAATKAYVLSFALALNEELESKGIRSFVLCPGAVKTEFAEIATDGVMKQFTHGVSPAETVRKTLKAIKKKKILIIPRFEWKITALAASFLPKVLLSKIAGKKKL